jgi:hypothetical protein
MSTGKNRIVYCDSDDGDEKIWSGYASRPEPEKNTAGSTLQLPSLQQEQLPDWGYAPYQYEQQTQDHAEQQHADPPAEKKKMPRKRCRSAAPKHERKQRRSTPARKKRARHTAAVSHRRPSIDLLEQSPQVLLRRVFFPQPRKEQISVCGVLSCTLLRSYD